MSEILLVRGIHLRKVGHVRDEDIDLDHLSNAATGLLEDGSEILDALLRFVADVALDQLSVLVIGDLP